jgi:hypothetical protein
MAPLHARAACPIGTADLRTDVEAASADYVAGRTSAFSVHVAAIDEEIDCLTELVDGETAARAHLVNGLHAALARDPAAATIHFRGAFAADPALEPSADVAAPGSLARSALDEAKALGDGETEPLEVGVDVVVAVDGATSASIPTERAALVQVLVPGSPYRTWALTGRGVPSALVEYARGPAPIEPLPTSDSVATIEPESPRTSRALFAASVVSGVASLTSLGIAQGYKSGFDDIDDQDKAEAHYQINHVFAASGYALGVAAVGLAATAVIVGKW